MLFTGIRKKTRRTIDSLPFSWYNVLVVENNTGGGQVRNYWEPKLDRVALDKYITREGVWVDCPGCGEVETDGCLCKACRGKRDEQEDGR